MNIVRLSYTWRVSFGLNNICLSCSRFVSVLFVVLVKIELDNVVKENYSSQICWSKNCSLRVFGSSTNDRLQISWRADLELDNEKRLILIPCGQLLRRLIIVWQFATIYYVENTAEVKWYF